MQKDPELWVTQSAEWSGWSSVDEKLKVGGNNQGESLGKIIRRGGGTYSNVCKVPEPFPASHTVFAAETGSISEKKANFSLLFE